MLLKTVYGKEESTEEYSRQPQAILCNKGKKGGVRIKWGCHLPRLPKQTEVVETIKDDMPHGLWTSTFAETCGV